MISRNQFETRTFKTVQTILGEECPSLDVLRKPTLTSTGRGRGRKVHFAGLSEEHRERIKVPPGSEGTTPLVNFGMRLVSYQHRDCRAGVFDGLFEAYIVRHLHQHYAGDPQSAEGVAKLYGLDPATVAKASGIYRTHWNRGTGDWLIRSFAKGTIGAEIARHEKSQALFEADRRAS